MWERYSVQWCRVQGDQASCFKSSSWLIQLTLCEGDVIHRGCGSVMAFALYIVDNIVWADEPRRPALKPHWPKGRHQPTWCKRYKLTYRAIQSGQIVARKPITWKPKPAITVIRIPTLDPRMRVGKRYESSKAVGDVPSSLLSRLRVALSLSVVCRDRSRQ